MDQSVTVCAVCSVSWALPLTGVLLTLMTPVTSETQLESDQIFWPLPLTPYHLTYPTMLDGKIQLFNGTAAGFRQY